MGLWINPAGQRSYGRHTRRAVTPCQAPRRNVCRMGLRVRLRLSALLKRNASLQGERLAQADNVPCDCCVIPPVSGLQHTCIS